MMTMTNEQSEKLAEWEKASLEFGKWQAKEKELRGEVVALFADSNKKKGTENFALPNNHNLKIVKKQNYNLNKDKINDVLDQIDTLGGEQGKLISQRLVRFKPELSITEYNQLPEQYLPLINSVLTITDGSPTVEIEAPKAKAKI